MFVTNIFHFKLYKKYNNSKIFLYNNICNKLILRTSDWQLTNTSNIPKTSSHEKENRNCFPSPTRLSPSIRSLEDLLEYARHEKSAWRVDDSIKWNEEISTPFFRTMQIPIHQMPYKQHSARTVQKRLPWWILSMYTYTHPLPRTDPST